MWVTAPVSPRAPAALVGYCRPIPHELSKATRDRLQAELDRAPAPTGTSRWRTIERA